jgi:WD40 repeat protein
MKFWTCRSTTLAPELSLHPLMELLAFMTSLRQHAYLRLSDMRVKSQRYFLSNSACVPFHLETHSLMATPYSFQRFRLGLVNAYASTLLPHTIFLYFNMHIKVSFNPQGNRVISASSDKTCRLWDVETGESLQV